MRDGSPPRLLDDEKVITTRPAAAALINPLPLPHPPPQAFAVLTLYVYTLEPHLGADLEARAPLIVVFRRRCAPAAAAAALLLLLL